MGKGKPLTSYQKGQIDAKLAQKMSHRQIARDLKRSPKNINNYAKNPALYGTAKSPGRPSSLSDREKRKILRHASNSVDSCTKIKADLKLKCSAETVRRVISKSNFLKRRKMRKSPFLTQKHRDQRLDFARKNQKTDWRKVS